MSPKFKILDKKNIYDGFFKMNEVTLKYKKYDGNWSNEIKRELFGGAQVSAVLPYDPINKKIVFVKNLQIAGDDVTSDLSQGLQITHDSSERVKIIHGTLNPPFNEKIEIDLDLSYMKVLAF